MKRKIVRIDEEKCDGCGLCVEACHEGALRIVDGKARLVSDSYCDGLGACLPECPAGAIVIEEREAADFDEAAVKSRAANAGPETGEECLACGCPGTQAHAIERKTETAHPCGQRNGAAASQLRQWPCQLKLVPVNAPYFDQAHLLVAADCTAYAYAGMHQDYMRGRITLIGCPKLDRADYAGRLTEIMKAHELKSVTVIRMEVPCCGGIVEAVREALAGSGRMIPWRVVTVGTDGRIREEI